MMYDCRLLMVDTAICCEVGSYLPLLLERSARVMHLGLSVCLFGRVAQAIAQIDLIFFTQGVLYPWQEFI